MAYREVGMWEILEIVERVAQPVREHGLRLDPLAMSVAEQGGHLRRGIRVVILIVDGGS